MYKAYNDEIMDQLTIHQAAESAECGMYYYIFECKKPLEISAMKAVFDTVYHHIGWHYCKELGREPETVIPVVYEAKPNKMDEKRYLYDVPYLDNFDYWGNRNFWPEESVKVVEKIIGYELKSYLYRDPENPSGPPLHRVTENETIEFYHKGKVICRIYEGEKRWYVSYLYASGSALLSIQPYIKYLFTLSDFDDEEEL